MTSLAQRALAHVTESRDAARERIQRENADLLLDRQTYMDRFGATSTYLRCEQTGREWGKPCTQRWGGKAVPASASGPKGKPLKERR